MSTPDYYMTADGTQFCDFFDGVVGPIIIKHVSMPVYHAIVSAAEHRFRMGYKSDMESHDIEAEEWWLNRARYLSGFNKNIEWVIRVTMSIIDYERMCKRAGESPWIIKPRSWLYDQDAERFDREAFAEENRS